MADFAVGFQFVNRICLTVAGGVSAVLLFVLVLACVAFLAGMVFDKATVLIANRWEKKGYQPRNKLGRIIWENHKRLGE